MTGRHVMHGTGFIGPVDLLRVQIERPAPRAHQPVGAGEQRRHRFRRLQARNGVIALALSHGLALQRQHAQFQRLDRGRGQGR